MAHGQMILLKDEECRDQPKYCGLNKTYIFRVLYGVSTDTYDLLGKIIKVNNPNIDTLNLNNYIGKTQQKYPHYSSKIVNKKPLWLWAKEGNIEKIEIPSKEVEIFTLEEIEDVFDKDSSTQIIDIHSFIKRMIHSLSEENKTKFRVNEILKLWHELFSKSKNLIPIIKTYKANVSSGTYIRGLVDKIGNDLGCGAITLNIFREKFDLQLP